MQILFSSFLFSGLGGLGPEYLLHATGPASTLASSEFPFSIDGKSNNVYPLFNVHADVCSVTELCVPSLAHIGVVAGRRSTG